ncbi:InlB B-repeat-containing protein [Lacinutrix jangbogonensis]|uniref:InlB B-repeat-containing protein n=1 Tax=Lacinutrix jangbogonensis TaxID=1469557 RepID=UPI00068E72E6|nr:T9SS type A sorting domain-containing protein [Lacinutrix jangbogonensis]
MKTKLLLLFTLLSSLSYSQTFDWESVSFNGTNYVRQTVAGIQAECTNSSNDVTVLNGGGFAGTTGNIIVSGQPVNSITVTFSAPINIQSIYAFDGNAAAGSRTFSPTGGANSNVVAILALGAGSTVNVNWTGVTSFTITESSGGLARFAIDDIVFTPYTVPGCTGTVNIPDTNFELYLANNSAIDTNNDNEIQCSEASAFTGTIDCSSLNITDLTGIEAFTALTSLNCSDNLLTYLNVSNNTNLTDLNFNYTSISSIDLSNNTALTELRCVGNSLTNLNVSTNTGLTYLDCNNNSISTINVVNNTGLTYLDLTSNSLNSLNVSTNTGLTYLHCNNNNNINSLDISNNLSLTDLNCANNSINSLSVITNTNLTKLNCASNSLMSLNVSNNTSLTELFCHSNSLMSLNVSNNTSLTKLSCSYNSISSLDVSNHTNLVELYCRSNGLTSLNVANGNNTNITTNRFDAGSNPDLTCIQVDNVAYSTANWTYIDPASSFSLNCQTTIQRTLAITATNGSVATNPNPTNGTYTDGTVVSVIPTPDAGYQFDGWSVDASGTTNPLSITMDSDKTITAIFSLIPIQHTLTIIETNSTVTVSPSPINGTYADGTVVTLTVTPDAGYIYNSWNISNYGVFSQNPTTITVTADTTIEGVSVIERPVLTINAINGTVTTNPNPVNGTYASGEEIVLTAIPDTGYQFDGWSGDASGNSNLTGITMDSNRTVTATFSSIQRTLIVNIIGTGTVDVASGTVYNHGDVVTLTATPGSSFAIKEWTGDVVAGTVNSIQITMNADKAVTVEFEPALGINEVDYLQGLKIYPNPTNAILNIQLYETLEKVEVFSLLGTKVLESSSSRINVSNLSKGMYLLKIETQKGEVGVKRFIKE